MTLSQVLFGVGMVLCVVLLGMVAYRLRTLPMPEGALPMICILAAPFSLGLTDYLAAYAQPSMAVALAMVVVAQALYVFVLTQVPRLLKLVHRQFFPSVAAMTFPFAISAVALGRFLAFLASSGIAYPVVLDGLAFVEAVIAVTLVVWATVRYVMFFAHTPRVEQPTVQ
jgi:exfoliative toxin A/B